MNEPTYHQIDGLVKRIANKLAADYDLEPDSFDIKWVPTSDERMVAMTAGLKPTIMFAIWPNDPDFELFLRNALQRVGALQRTGAIESVASIQRHLKEFEEIRPRITDEPTLPASQFEIQLHRRVVVRHKPTGLIVSEEAREGKVTWSQLTLKAKLQLAKLAKLMENGK